MKHRKKTNNGRNRTSKSKKDQNTLKERKLQVLCNIRSRDLQTNGNKRKITRVIQTNEKTSKNQTESGMSSKE